MTRYTIHEAPSGYVVRDTATLMPTDYPGFGPDRDAAQAAADRLNARESNPQVDGHEAMRLFAPAPTQIEGQMML
jgi:hypothetical protein